MDTLLTLKKIVAAVIVYVDVYNMFMIKCTNHKPYANANYWINWATGVLDIPFFP